MTLTGAGGIGKTSLALELARERAADAPDGAWFVGLDAIDDPSQVGSVIARTLGLFDGTGGQAADALPGFMADRSMLLVLDNFEHVLAAIGRRFGTAARVRRARASSSQAGRRCMSAANRSTRSGRCRVAATDATDGETAAARLFVERARAVRPGWDPASDQAVIAEICTLLDGLPLGIELAAARMSLLPADAPSVTDWRPDCRCPERARATRPARQRTLAGAIEWSHDLLRTGRSATCCRTWRSSRAASTSSRPSASSVREADVPLGRPRRPDRPRRPEPDRP